MSEYKRLTARNQRNIAYLVKVKENEQEVDSKYPNTLRCIMDSFQRLAEYEDSGLSPSEVSEIVKAIAEYRLEEVVRCKDCVIRSNEEFKNRDNSRLMTFCYEYGGNRYLDDYCNHGTTKEEAEEAMRKFGGGLNGTL